MERLLKIGDVCDRTGVSRATIYRMEARGEFVRRVHVTECAVRWPESKVAAWIAERIGEGVAA